MQKPAGKLLTRLGIADTKKQECWDALQKILDDYKKQGKSVYTETFIEDNEDKVKALQETYQFTYTVELKK